MAAVVEKNEVRSNTVFGYDFAGSTRNCGCGGGSRVLAMEELGIEIVVARCQMALLLRGPAHE